MVNCEILLKQMLYEMNKQYRGGVYGYTSRALAYNSNRIEGSTLTEEQTANLFEEGVMFGDTYSRHDVEEMTGHFLMFNKMLLTLKQPLTESLIKEFHYQLKAGVFEDRANGYAIGDYKTRANTVGGKTLVSPENVHSEMVKLLKWFNGREKSLEALAWFHATYELIHPFQDGNGRTGRILLFRECIVNNISPFIIRDINRVEYIRAIGVAQKVYDVRPMVELFKLEQECYEREVSPYML